MNKWRTAHVPCFTQHRDEIKLLDHYYVYRPIDSDSVKNGRSVPTFQRNPFPRSTGYRRPLILWIFGKLVPNYTASQPRRPVVLNRCAECAPRVWIKEVTKCKVQIKTKIWNWLRCCKQKGINLETGVRVFDDAFVKLRVGHRYMKFENSDFN